MSDAKLDPHGLTVFSDAGTELEVQELLFALVRVLRPALIVETGCYDGLTTLRLVQAAAATGGRVVTCDTDSMRVAQTNWRLAQEFPAMASPSPWTWRVLHCRGIDLPELHEADLIFCDSDYACRRDEIMAAKPGAVIVVHDTLISYNPEVEPLAGVVEQLGGVTFTTHRGFGILKVPAGGWS